MLPKGAPPSSRNAPQSSAASSSEPRHGRLVWTRVQPPRGGGTCRIAEPVRRRAPVDAGRWAGARHPHARVPLGHGPHVQRAGGSGDGYRDLRVSRPAHRLALAQRLPPPGPARVRRRARLCLAALVLRPAGDLRPRPHPVPRRGAGRALFLSGPPEHHQYRAWADQHDPRPPLGLWRALGGRSLLSVGRGGNDAGRGVRRRSRTGAPDRDRSGYQPDSPQRRGAQPRFQPYAAHVLLPHQCGAPGARCRIALPGADRRRGLGRS